MGLHDDHRKRLRSVYLNRGPDALDDTRLLELYLFYTNPRSDVNPLAVRLLERFGTLDGVFSAGLDELCSVSGVGENTAVLLTMLKPLYRRAALSAADTEFIINSADDAEEFLSPYFFGLTYETVFLLCLTASGHVLRCENLGSGSVNSAQFSPANAAAAAVRGRASCVIIAHNHVNGTLDPSKDDVDATAITAEAMKREGILLLDHLIFSVDGTCSLRERGLYSPADF